MAVYTGSNTLNAIENEVLDNNLVEQVALQAIHTVPSLNPLFEVFEKENIDTGAEIQEILIREANIENYDPEGKTTLKPRNLNIVTQYYNDYDHNVYTTTVYDDEIRKVSLKPEKKAEFIAGIVGSLTETRDDNVFSQEKKVLSDMVTKYPGLNLGTIAGTTTEERSKNLTIMIKNAIDNMRFKNENYIPYNIDNPTSKIKNRAYFDRIRIIIPYSVKNAIDVEYLANAYNLDKAEIKNKFVEIDEGNYIYILDRMSVFRFPQTDKLKNNENGEGDFINYFLHVNAMLGACTLFKFAYIDATSIINPTANVTNVNVISMPTE